jgi:hypothetical protein
VRGAHTKRQSANLLCRRSAHQSLCTLAKDCTATFIVDYLMLLTTEIARLNIMMVNSWVDARHGNRNSIKLQATWTVRSGWQSHVHSICIRCTRVTFSLINVGSGFSLPALFFLFLYACVYSVTECSQTTHSFVVYYHFWHMHVSVAPFP